MKLLPIIFFVLLLQACANEKSEPKTEKAFSEVAMNKKLQEKAEDYNAEKIVSLNFDQLEKQYFQKTTDTIYIINFWATWCKPCIKELPAFEKIAKDFSGKK